MSSSENLKAWRRDPCLFVKVHFGVEPDAWQRDALMAYASKDVEKQRISLNACAGPGKTACLAWIGWNFLSCYATEEEHPKGACVAVTADNLKDNLWSEMYKWQQRSRYLAAAFTWQHDRIYCNDHAKTWFMSARTWSKSANAEEQGRTLSGIHSDFSLFLIDESGDIPISVLKSADQALTKKPSHTVHQKIIQAGNPTSHDGMLYEASVSPQWFVINITADPDDPKRTPRVDPEKARAAIDKWGRNDPWVKSYILGEFPDQSIINLLSLKEVEDAMNRDLPESAIYHSQKRLGVDVARYGMDSTVIFPRQGLCAFMYAQMRNADCNEVAARVMLAKARFGSEIELVDGTGGYGAGVYDALKQTQANVFSVEASKTSVEEGYYNMRAMCWFKMAEWIRSGASIPKCPELKKELLAPTYSYKNGRILIESKEQIVKRLGYSPDRADALSLTFAMAEMPSQETEKDLLFQYARKSYTSPKVKNEKRNPLQRRYNS